MQRTVLLSVRTSFTNVCVLAAEKRAAARQKRDDLIRRNPGEMQTGAKPGMHTDLHAGQLPHQAWSTRSHVSSSAESDQACGGKSGDPDTPTQSDGEDREEEPMAPLASTSEDLSSDLETSTGRMQLCHGLMEVIFRCIVFLGGHFCCTNLCSAAEKEKHECYS